MASRRQEDKHWGNLIVSILEGIDMVGYTLMDDGCFFCLAIRKI